MGPMTGRGLGLCRNYDSPGYVRRGFASGRGAGFGRGLGRGLGWRSRAFYDSRTPAAETDDLQMLKEESRRLNDDLKSINSRIREIEKT
jgi:hypothetical protein